MTIYKVTFQEEKTIYPDGEQPYTQFDTTAEIESDYPEVVAGFLRSLAGKMDQRSKSDAK